MLKNIITSLLAFVSTNIDDIFVLMLFFSNRKFSESRIIIGQYLGIGALVIAAFIGSYIGNFIDQRYIGILGLFPIYLGIRHIMEAIRKKGDAKAELQVDVRTGSAITVAAVTIGNGGDNIGVYVPLLTTMTASEKVQLAIVFAVMTYLWCMAGKYLAFHPLIAKQLDKFGHVIIPMVLILLGVFILFESGTFSLLN